MNYRNTRLEDVSDDLSSTRTAPGVTSVGNVSFPKIFTVSDGDHSDDVFECTECWVLVRRSSRDLHGAWHDDRVNLRIEMIKILENVIVTLRQSPE